MKLEFNDFKIISLVNVISCWIINVISDKREAISDKIENLKFSFDRQKKQEEVKKACQVGSNMTKNIWIKIFAHSDIQNLKALFATKE